MDDGTEGSHGVKLNPWWVPQLMDLERSEWDCGRVKEGDGRGTMSAWYAGEYR